MQKKSCFKGSLNENKKVVNKKRRHPERAARRVSGSHLVAVLKSGEIPYQVRNDNRNNTAFTLIELLVVVLIIGILAAVAVPQYQKAVWKSRNAQLKSIVRTVATAEETFFMANGQYAGNFDELSIDLPLDAPVQSSGGALENICSMATKGADSVRRGKDFQVVLNTVDPSAVLVVQGWWTDGPYKCTGFSFPLPGSQLYCLEPSNGSTSVPLGGFCEKLERGTNRTVSGGHRWNLP